MRRSRILLGGRCSVAGLAALGQPLGKQVGVSATLPMRFGLDADSGSKYEYRRQLCEAARLLAHLGCAWPALPLRFQSCRLQKHEHKCNPGKLATALTLLRSAIDQLLELLPLHAALLQWTADQVIAYEAGKTSQRFAQLVVLCQKATKRPPETIDERVVVRREQLYPALKSFDVLLLTLPELSLSHSVLRSTLLCRLHFSCTFAPAAGGFSLSLCLLGALLSSGCCVALRGRGEAA